MAAESAGLKVAAIDYRLVPIGDSGVLVDCGERIESEVNAWVRAAARAIEAAKLAGVLELVPTYRSLAVFYDSCVVRQAELLARLPLLLDRISLVPGAARRWRIPVCYGGEYGIDLEPLAERHELSPAQLVERHAARIYRIYMIGFMPGFAYLGGLDPSLHTPRRDSPRSLTPAGSISIGGAQTAVASVAAPSGWHLIGRTPVRTFEPERERPFLLDAGDEVRFVPIDHARFAAFEACAEEDWQWSEAI